MFSKISISRMCSVLLVVVMLIGSAAFPASVRAGGGGGAIVTTIADNTLSDGQCSLREAITNTNNNAKTFGDCTAGSVGNDLITFDSSLGTATITLASTLPTITDGNDLTIDGDNRITLSGNDSVQVLYVNDGMLTLQNISVTHGKAATGGGLWNFLGTVIILHSSFSNNGATGAGGGVSNSDIATITNSTFSNNSAGSDGGGVANITGTLTIANSTFSNNSATGAGGGLENNGGTATILNSTFSGNSATLWGGGLSTYTGDSTAPTTIIHNTILANSVTGEDCWNDVVGGGILIGGNNIIETTSSCTSLATIPSDPNLGSLTGSPAYFPLNAGSPAIDTGNDAICTAVPVSNASQNGLIRPQGTHCDIGSYEANATLAFRSAGAQDGWILESSETSNKGGAMNSTATTLRLGDDAAKKQNLGILSFSTKSLPDTAVITKVTLKVRKQGIIGGGNPVTMFQGFMVDVKNGTFGTAALQTSDFQTAASKTYGPFKPALIGGWYSIDLTNGKAYINKLATNGGLTQIRLRFKVDDNNNAVANTLSLFSGNAPAASQPQLIIEYYVP